MSAEKHLYQRFAQIGRVVLIQYGPDRGKLATIVDIIDQNRALIDGPENLTGVGRQVINFKWIALTDFTVEAPRNARQKTLNKVWKKAGIVEKWAASAWGKKLAAKGAKLQLTDFQRFEAKVAKQAAMKKVRAAIKK